MLPVSTTFTKFMNIKSPIVSAPMYLAAGPELVSAVTSAGGFGFVGAGIDSVEKVVSAVRSVGRALNIPAGSPVPMGVGFLGWILDMTERSNEPRLPACLNELPAAIWFAFGNDLGKYVAQVRAHDAKRSHKTVIFTIVNTVEEALRAAHEWKVDVLVVQGVEAGGHGSSNALPTFEFLPAVLEAIPNGPHILAAGGIATGTQIAAALTMGASGVALGTRYLFTPESYYTAEMQAALVEAGPNATARSFAYDDHLPIPAHWPEGIDGRAIANGIYADSKLDLSVEARKKRFADAQARGDKNYLLVWAGVGSALTKDIRPAIDVTRDLHNEAVAALKSVPALIG